MDYRLIEEVLPLVPEEWKDILEELMRRTPESKYNSRFFSMELALGLANRLGQPPSLKAVDTAVSKVEKKLKSHSCIHLIVELNYLRSYGNSFDADDDLRDRRTRCTRPENYYDGEFISIQGKKIFSFEKTLGANKARLCDFELAVVEKDTSKILPLVEGSFVQVDPEVVVVTKLGIKRVREEGMKEAREEGMEAGKRKVIKYVCQAYQIDERELENVMVDTTVPVNAMPVNQSLLAMPVNRSLLAMPVNRSLLEIQPDEISKFKHIMTQYQHSVQLHKLKVAVNVCNMIQGPMPRERHISKYQLSRPDGAVFRECAAYIHGSDKDALLLCNSDDDSSDAVEHISQMLENNVGIVVERATQPKNDPVGQLFAGLDKMLGDLIHDKLCETGQVIMALTLYGVFVNTCDECEVYQFKIIVNKKPEVFKGRQKLSLSEVLNRLTAAMIRQ